MTKKNWFYWVLAIIITLGAAYYQKKTGPTYPKTYKFLLEGHEEKFILPTSHEGKSDCDLKLFVKEHSANGFVLYKRHPSDDAWQKISFSRFNDTLYASLPNQPPAGKLVYYIELYSKSGIQCLLKDKPVIIRFKGVVPLYILIPHIVFIFLAMLISNLAGLMALGKKKSFRYYGKIAFFLLLIGGMILGPVVQKFAFNEFWAGVPFGFDLTDNKMLIAFIFWLFAFIVNFKKERTYAIIIAAIVTIIIFSIPHSLYGSELNFETGNIIQG
ncbi:MAG: hypothetical protein ABIJ97_11925 [Bacteroidota bacterium]